MTRKIITREELDQFLRKHKLWLDDEEGGERADLCEADLRGANLRGADLREADLDYSCLPLWCGSLAANFDDRQLIQITYHLVKSGLGSTNATNDTKNELKKLIDLANKFHRVDECGKIKYPDASERFTEKTEDIV